MPRQKENYQANLDRLLLKFDGKETLTKADVMQYLGVGKEALLNLQVPFIQAPAKRGKQSGGKAIISTATFASWLS